MSNDYDKIIKENIEEVFLPLAEKYLGQSTPKMRTQLKDSEVMKGCSLVNLHALDHKQLLHSQIPEEII